MKPTRIAALVVLCVMVIGYFTVTNERAEQNSPDHELYFPELLERINSADRIVISMQQTQFSTVRDNNTWVVEQYDSYPADMNLVQNLLVGLSQLTRLEAKTDDPEKHARLDLAGFQFPNSKTMRVTVYSRRDEAIADLYVGRTHESVSSPNLTEYFVRHPQRNQVWLVRGALPLVYSPLDWLDSQIINLDRSEVREVQIQNKNSTPIRVYKSSATDRNFMLGAVAHGAKVRHQFKINDIGEVFRNLSFLDVQRSDVWQSSTKVIAVTFDGLQVTAQLAEDEWGGYAQFSAEASNEAATDVHERAARLNNKWEGWAYRLSDARVKTINTRFNELIESKNPDDG